MKIAILSTDTKHHTYFINRISERFPVACVAYERRRLTKPYRTGPFFTAEEDAFEERFFDPAHDGTSSAILPATMERLIEVHDVNQEGMAAYLNAINPDLIISFGVGRITPAIFTIPRWGTINVHRGISQAYRGLDSDLWAILHNRFDLIGVTVHYVDAHLDTGDILSQEVVSVKAEDEIFHLRYKTTLAATRMVINLLERFKEKNGALQGAKLKKGGDYFSAMPLHQKRETLRHFEAYRKKLRNA